MSEPDDKLLDDYLGRESAVSQRYRELEAPEVPPQLDAAVLSQARAAIAQPRKRQPAWVRWGTPIALAASVVMAVAIVLEVGVQDTVRTPAPRMESAPSAERAERSRAVQEADLDAPAAAPSPLQAPPPPTPAPQVARDTAAAGSSAAPAIDERATSADKPTQDVAEARRAIVEQRPSRAFVRSRAASEPAPLEAAPPAPTASQRNELPERPAEADVAAEAPRLPPQAWLEHIRTLRAEGKVLEADEQWRQFREAYPDFEVEATDAARPLPADLGPRP